MADHLAPNDDSGPEGGSEEGLDIRDYLRVLWTYKWVILLVAAGVTTLVVFWTLRQPKVYQATATIEYDPNPQTPLGREVEDVANPVGSFWMSREFFATQNRIISSRAVSERVVRELELHRDPSFFYVDEDARAEWEEVSVAQAARTLQSRLVVEAIDETRIVAIRITDHDAERAATLANAVADAYIAKTLEDRVGSTVSALDWLGSRLDTLRGQLETSEDALHQFKLEHNIVSVSMEDRQNLVASDIQHFNEALTTARTRRIELQARAARLQTAAEGENPEDSASAFPENEAISGLVENLRQKISERDGLATRYGPNHQRMQELTQQIEGVRRQLREEMTGVVRAAQADVREVRRVETGIRSALDEATRNGLNLNLREIEYQRLNRERENNSKLYTLVLERTTETNLTRRFSSTHARTLDPALPPGFPMSPNVSLNAAGGLLAGVALGLAFAFLLGRLDRRLKSVADVEALGLTIIGVLPRIDQIEEQPVYGSRRRRRAGADGDTDDGSRDLFAHTHPMSAAAECCRTIRTNLTFMSADDPIRAMVVTSASPREGKTTVTTNVAISLAQSGKRVLIVDTDLRRPRVHRAFGLRGNVGITSVIVGDRELSQVTQSTDIKNLEVLACGPIPPNPSELLHSSKFTELVELALTRYDRVIFDSPPLGAVTDAAVLAPQLDAALLVVKSHSTTRDALGSALRQLRDVGANVVGGVLNDLDPKRKGYGNGYYYYRREGYYYADENGNDDDSSSGDDESGPRRAAAH